MNHESVAQPKLRKRRLKNIFFSGMAAVFSSLLWLCAAILGVMADVDGICWNDLRFAIFQNKSERIYRSYMTSITLPSWTFAVREFIYAWNMLWATYCVGTMCSSEKQLLRQHRLPRTAIFPTRFHVFWCICSVTHIAWLLLWDREAFVASLFVQGFVIASCIAALVLSHDKTYRSGALLQFKHPWDLWVARTLVQNGILMMAVWNLFLLAVNMVILLVHGSGLPMQFTSVVVLGIFGAIVFVWFILEMCIFDKWFRYSFSFYLTVIWIMSGILGQHFIILSPVTIISLGILGFSFIALIIRVPIVVWRSFSSPLYIEQTIPHKVDVQPKRQHGVTTVL